MPQTIVEHSFPIKKEKISELFLLINENISQSEGEFNILKCKTRSIFCPDFVIADGVNTDFMHITIKILNSRSLEIRKNLSEKIFNTVEGFLKENKLSNRPIDLSLDVREMEKAIYQNSIV